MIFDLDMTLIDVHARYCRCMEELGFSGNTSLKTLSSKDRAKFWKLFLSDKYIWLDKPIDHVIKIARERFRRGYGILILTGRPVDMELITRRQLEEFGIPYHSLIMRPKGYYEETVKFKKEIVDYLINLGLKIVEIHDDDYEFIKLINKDYPAITTVLHRTHHPKVNLSP